MSILKDKTTFKEYPSLLLKGFLMGAADVVPGVSGGTMALILGVYNRLLDAIKSLSGNAIKSILTFKFSAFFETFHWKFLLGLVSGIFAAIIFFTRVIPLQELMFTKPEPIYGLYFGLILGSIFLLVKSLKQIDFSSLFFIVLGTAFGWWIINLVPTQTPENYAFIFGSGALAICAMILPGISGSFILLILGKYQFIFGQVKNIGGPETTSALLILFVFVLGMITGITLFSRFLSWLLKRFHKPTLCVLIGFLIGSLSVIWPFQERSFEEIVKQETVSYTDLRVSEIMQNGVESNKPEFYRIALVINPDDLLQNRMVILEKVKKKLIHSDPFFPSFDSALTDTRLSNAKESLYWGFGAMLIGLFLVIGIEKLADKDAY